jgi:hypothetical protein
MGRLPFAGEWVRLGVPAAAVGLAGATVTGMAFTLRRACRLGLRRCRDRWAVVPETL